MSIPQLRPSPSLLSLHDIHPSFSHTSSSPASYNSASQSSESAFTALPKVAFYSLTLLAVHHSEHVGIEVAVLVAGIWIVAALGILRNRKPLRLEVISLSKVAILAVAFLLQSACVIVAARHYDAIRYAVTALGVMAATEITTEAGWLTGIGLTCFTLIESVYLEDPLTPAFALSGSLLITLILPQITRHEIFASEVIVVQEKAGGSSRGRSKTKLLTELELGICGAAIISLSVLGMSWMGIISPASLHIHHNVVHSSATLVLISILVGLSIVVDSSRTTNRIVIITPTLNPLIPNLRNLGLLSAPDVPKVSHLSANRKKLSTTIGDIRRTGIGANTARRSFLGRGLGVMVAGVLMNEETPSWSDWVIGIVIYIVLRMSAPPATSIDAEGKHEKPVSIAEAYQPPEDSSLHNEDQYVTVLSLLPVSTRPVLKSILSSPESRPIFYFLLLNLAYLFVQLLWGVWTNSLGLISDAVHMAFDCAALGVGLAASLMARWEKGGRWTYGYDRIQTLSGFANGVFLILISVFIFFEGVQRIMNPPEMQNMTQLLLVSSGGLAINLWGMYATGHHHHGHSHGGDDCGHGHSHGSSANMRGVFLHVLADTLGSVGVIVSTLLIEYTGYTIFDPIASLFIAGLIVASVIPLVVDSGRILCLELAPEKANEIQQALLEVSNVEGVASFGGARFWPADETTLVGSIHIQLAVSSSGYDPSRPVDALSNSAPTNGARQSVIYADATKVRRRVEKALRNRISGLKELNVQMEGMAPNYCSCTT